MGTKYEKTVVNIDGPGNYSANREVVAGESATITDELPDGLYKWEAVTVPRIPENVKSELMAVRQSGNMSKSNELMEKYREQGLYPTESEILSNRLSGSFRIHEGNIIDNTDEE
jgi:hypothetical protein